MKVLIFNPYAKWVFHAAYEVVAYHNLRDAGHDVDYITCNGGFSDCDLYWRNLSGIRPESACNGCVQSHSVYFSKYKIAPTFLGDSISDSERQAALEIVERLGDLETIREFVYEGINIFDCVVSSIYSQFRAGTLDFEDAQMAAMLKRYMLIGVSTAMCVVKILTDKRPDAVFMFNGRMAPTRVFLELALQRGIRVVCHERSLTRGHIWLFENSHCLSLEGFRRAYFPFHNRPLTNGRILRVLDWLADKSELKAENWHSFNVDSEEANKKFLYPALSPLPNGHLPKIWTLFTSSTDEINSGEAFISPFGSQSEWIKSTVEFVSKRGDEIRLVIRVHPNTGSSVSSGRNQDELSFYKTLSEVLPSNVTLLSSDCGVNSYRLLEKADLVLCFGSTIGIEAAGRGLPVLFACSCIYTFCRGVRYINTPSSYYQMLEDALVGKAQLPVLEIKRHTFRFLDWLLFEFPLNIPCVVQTTPHMNIINAASLAEFARGFYPALDQLTDIILGGRGIESRRTISSRLATFEEETHYLESADIKKRASDPFISVIIPCYNGSKTVVRCLDSLKSQTYRNFEVIVIDDGSKDNSANLVEDWLSRNSDIRGQVIVQENSGQPAIPRNVGLEAASGRFILPLDCDDMIMVGYLKAIYEAHCSNPSANVIFASYFRVSSVKGSQLEGRILTAGRFAWGALLKQNQIVVCSAFTKALALECGGYNTNIPGYEDWDLWLRMSTNGAIPIECKGPGLIYFPSDNGMADYGRNHHETHLENILRNVKSFRHSY